MVRNSKEYNASYYRAHIDERRAYDRQRRPARHPYFRQYNGEHKADRNAWARQKDYADLTEQLKFVAFDGEGSDGRYQLLACSATEEVIKAEGGLSTIQCLDYFLDLIDRGVIEPVTALIGFGLSYDFENILRDVSDADYDMLRLGKQVTYEGYRLKYINRKFLDVSKGKVVFRLQDIYPYFQQSFIKACASRGIELPDIVYEGKRRRTAFRYKDMDKIIDYNRAELVAMVRLAETLRDEFVAAFKVVNIIPSIGKFNWFGPGAQAMALLNSADFHQLTVNTTAFGVEALQKFLADWGPILKKEKERRKHVTANAVRAVQGLVSAPFSAAYFGGRIEASMQGRFDGTLYDYDLTSAYPYAITRLPDLSHSTLIRVNGVDESNRIGAYLVRWSFPSANPYYPFPFRARNGNVFFPRTGYGWVLSTELTAAIRANLTGWEVESGWVLTQTDGYGSGEQLGNSKLATLIVSMGEHRAIAKRTGDPAHRGLKLLMNSVYGKTLQKEGSRRFFNALVAAWITSYTRSRIYELIGGTLPGQVISVMTDGVLSTVPLSTTLSDELGGWTETRYAGGYQFAPGVYQLFPEDGGPPLVHYRGFLRFNADDAAKALDSRTPYVSANPVFVSRPLSLHNAALAKSRYQFTPIERKEDFSLSSKRDMEHGVRMGSATYYPPKGALFDSLLSWPYNIYGSKASLLKDDEDSD